MSAFRVDGDFTVASATAKPTFSNPFPEVNVQYVLRQPFMQLLANFAALDLNTAHPDFADFKLVEESDRIPIGAGLVTWERTYASLPADFDQFESTNYFYIGYYGLSLAINVTASTGRKRRSRRVNSRITNEFFLTGPGGSYDDPADIPIIAAQIYYYGNPDVVEDYIGDSPPLDTPTTPSRTDYEAMIAAGDEIVAEDSDIVPWIGNYYIRRTRYVKAK